MFNWFWSRPKKCDHDFFILIQHSPLEKIVACGKCGVEHVQLCHCEDCEPPFWSDEDARIHNFLHPEHYWSVKARKENHVGE